MNDTCVIQPPDGQDTPIDSNATGAAVFWSCSLQAIVSDSPLDSDQTLQLTLTYHHDGQAVQSNTVTLNLEDAGEPGQTYTGDQRAKLMGTEIDPNILPGDPQYGTYNWSATHWLQDGTLNGGVAEADFADVIRAGGGDDFISSSAGLGAPQRLRPDDTWNAPAGKEVKAASAIGYSQLHCGNCHAQRSKRHHATRFCLSHKSIQATDRNTAL